MLPLGKQAAAAASATQAASAHAAEAAAEKRGRGLEERASAANPETDAVALAQGAQADEGAQLAEPDFEAEYREAQAALDKRVPLGVKVGIALALALVLVMVVSYCLGKYPVPLGDVARYTAAQIAISFTNVGIFFSALAQGLADAAAQGTLPQFIASVFGGTMPADYVSMVDPTANALFNIRWPRVVVVVLVGAALSVAGAAYQGMFKNPLVSPDLLGASAGASFGACLALLLDMPNSMVQLFAFAGGMAAVGCAVWLNRIVKSDAILGLILGGILVSTLFQSGTSLVKLMADANDKLPTITFWLMGSFAGESNKEMWAIIVPILCGFVLLLLESWKLNVLSFGDEEARSMGIKTKRVRLIVIFASTLVVSCSVAVSGIVGWVGLVIPHLARALVGPNYRALLPASMVIGASYLLIVDNIARMIATVEIPIGILTSILGVPFFIFIFMRNQKGW